MTLSKEARARLIVGGLAVGAAAVLLRGREMIEAWGRYAYEPAWGWRKYEPDEPVDFDPDAVLVRGNSIELSADLMRALKERGGELRVPFTRLIRVSLEGAAGRLPK